MSKRSLRKEIIKKMKQFSEQEQKLSADQYLTQQLLNLSEYKSAKRIGIVLSMAHEVD
ncbi:5-formyltetrahydrofolate cyclo-ligase, partial [bacterium M00.F.Ca.ET.177.01.1.1]